LARGLGAVREVASPTFAILHEYGRREGIRLRHLDLYRLDDRAADLEILGLPESVAGAPVVVEWPGAAIRNSCRRRSSPHRAFPTAEKNPLLHLRADLRPQDDNGESRRVVSLAWRRIRTRRDESKGEDQTAGDVAIAQPVRVVVAVVVMVAPVTVRVAQKGAVVAPVETEPKWGDEDFRPDAALAVKRVSESIDAGVRCAAAGVRPEAEPPHSEGDVGDRVAVAEVEGGVAQEVVDTQVAEDWPESWLPVVPKCVSVRENCASNSHLLVMFSQAPAVGGVVFTSTLVSKIASVPCGNRPPKR
jgi:hypothetical protein